jgi:osmotically-inducible protein OsmY
MKPLIHNFHHIPFKSLLIVCAIVSFTSCSQQQTDKEIKADITVKAKSNLNFAGVNYTVDKGVVTLTGKCPSEHAREEIEGTIKSINIVKSFIDSIQVAPVIITTDQPLKQAVDSVLMNYAAVDAKVSNDTVALMGKANRQDFTELMQKMKKLNPLQIKSNVKVEQ